MSAFFENSFSGKTNKRISKISLAYTLVCVYVLFDFTELMFTKVPSFYGFDDADEVTDFFIHHIEELSDDTIKDTSKKLMEIYNNNNLDHI